jgi:RNA polymerase sigma-70 factor, ECF subfamily
MDVTIGPMWETETSASLEPYVNLADGFEELYSREYPTLVAMAIALTGSRNDGEDMVQDTMVRTFLHWKRVKRFANPAAWCVKVLTNLCRDRWRRGRIEQRAWTRHGASNREVAGPSADHLAFWQSVRSLPTRWRMVMVLFYAGDHTTNEISSILGIPEGTVRSDLSRARQALARDTER